MNQHLGHYTSLAFDAMDNPAGNLAVSYLGEDGLRLGRHDGAAWSFDDFAQILLIVVPLALALAWTARSLRAKALGYAAAATITTATLFTYSRGGALALLLVLALAASGAGVDWRRLALVALGLALAAGLAAPDAFTRRLTTLRQLLPGSEEVLRPDSSFEKRKLFARVAWRVFLDSPVADVGVGNYTAHYHEHAEQVGSVARQYVDPAERRYPHSLYLQVAAETGLAGLAAFTAVCATGFALLRRARARFDAAGDAVAAGLARAVAAGLVGYLVSSLFLHGDFQRYLWLWFAIAAALAGIAERRRPAASAAAGAV